MVSPSHSTRSNLSLTTDRVSWQAETSTQQTMKGARERRAKPMRRSAYVSEERRAERIRQHAGRGHIRIICSKQRIAHARETPNKNAAHQHTCRGSESNSLTVDHEFDKADRSVCRLARRARIVTAARKPSTESMRSEFEQLRPSRQEGRVAILTGGPPPIARP